MTTHQQWQQHCKEFLETDNPGGLSDKIRQLLFYGGRIQERVDRLSMGPITRAVRALEECQVLSDLYMGVLTSTESNRGLYG